MRGCHYLFISHVLSLKSMNFIKTVLPCGDELHNSKWSFPRTSPVVKPGEALKSGSSAKPSGR